MARRIACVGEVMLELTLINGNAKMGVAGDTYNTAVYLNRLLPDIDVSYVTELGTDQLSQFVAEHAAAEGLDLDLLGRQRDKTLGLYAITVSSRGERSFTYWRSQSAARELFGPLGTIGLDRLSQFDLVYLSGISLAILTDEARRNLFNWAACYRSNGGLIAFDSNYRPSLWDNVQDAREAISNMWAFCDIALPTASDESELFGDPSDASIVNRIKSAGAKAGCLKRGELAPISLSNEETCIFSVQPELVVDTTAAGDSFNAGFLAGYMAGAGHHECVSAGHLLAAEVIRHRGAIIPLHAMPARTAQVEGQHEQI